MIVAPPTRSCFCSNGGANIRSDERAERPSSIKLLRARSSQLSPFSPFFVPRACVRMDEPATASAGAGRSQVEVTEQILEQTEENRAQLRALKPNKHGHFNLSDTPCPALGAGRSPVQIRPPRLKEVPASGRELPAPVRALQSVGWGTIGDNLSRLCVRSSRRPSETLKARGTEPRGFPQIGRVGVTVRDAWSSSAAALRVRAAALRV